MTYLVDFFIFQDRLKKPKDQFSIKLLWAIEIVVCQGNIVGSTNVHTQGNPNQLAFHEMFAVDFQRQGEFFMRSDFFNACY